MLKLNNNITKKINMSEWEIILNMLVITFLSFIIGLERELKNQPAGIRTHVLIGLGSTLFMTISIMLPEIYGSSVNDPGRIAAQVVSGVGFIGAGAIMKMGLNTKGLTTAANIWVISAVGLAVGAGMYKIAIFVTCIILLNLILVTEVKSKFLLKKKYFGVTIEFDKNKKTLTSIMKKIDSLDIVIINKSIEKNNESTTLKLLLSTKDRIDSLHISSKLKGIKEIKKILVEDE